jgi:hypothetical protein
MECVQLLLSASSLWYRWPLERLSLNHRYQRLGVINAVERLFGYLKQRTRRSYNNINTWRIKLIEDYAAAIAMVRNLTTLIKTQGGVLLVDRIAKKYRQN